MLKRRSSTNGRQLFFLLNHDHKIYKGKSHHCILNNKNISSLGIASKLVHDRVVNIIKVEAAVVRGNKIN